MSGDAQPQTCYGRTLLPRELSLGLCWPWRAAGAASLIRRCTATANSGHWRHTDALPALWVRNLSTSVSSFCIGATASCTRNSCFYY